MAEIQFTGNTTQLDGSLRKSQEQVAKTGAAMGKALEGQVASQYAGQEKPFLKMKEEMNLLPGVGVRAGAGIAAGLYVAKSAAEMILTRFADMQKAAAELNREIGSRTLDTASRLSKAGIDSGPVLKAINAAGGTASVDQKNAFAQLLADRGFSGSGQDLADLIRAYSQDAHLFGGGESVAAAGLLGFTGDQAKEAVLAYRQRTGIDLDPAVVQDAIRAQKDPRLPRPAAGKTIHDLMSYAGNVDMNGSTPLLDQLRQSQPQEVKTAAALKSWDERIAEEERKRAQSPIGIARSIQEQKDRMAKLQRDEQWDRGSKVASVVDGVAHWWETSGGPTADSKIEAYSMTGDPARARAIYAAAGEFDRGFRLPLPMDSSPLDVAVTADAIARGEMDPLGSSDNRLLRHAVERMTKILEAQYALQKTQAKKSVNLTAHGETGP